MKRSTLHRLALTLEAALDRAEAASRLTVLEAATGAYRVRDPQANWPRDDVAVYHYRSGAWACERDSDAGAHHPCEHIRACRQKEATGEDLP